MKILINGLNAKSGGGKSILNNYLSLLKNRPDGNKYYILTPIKSEYIQYESENIWIVDIPSMFKRLTLLPFTYGIYFNRIIKKLDIVSIFNLADIPINTNTYQVFLFDWPYAVYPDSKIWDLMSKQELLKRQFKLLIFRYYSRNVNHFIVQTDVIENRLQKYFNCQKTSVIASPVTLESYNRDSFDFKLPEGKKLLYLSYYYPHKNFEIFIKLGKLIKKQGQDFKLIITISIEQGKKAYSFLKRVQQEGLIDIIINIGPVETKYISSLYNQVDGLLMPTLLETYGLPYIEAFHNNIPVFTSDFDFARAVCGDAAKYFNPFDEHDIFKTMEILNDNNEVDKMKRLGQNQLKKILDWNKVFPKYQSILLKAKKIEHD